MKTSEPYRSTNRREFLRRGAGGTLTGLAGLLLSRRPLHAADGGRNPFAYDVEQYTRTDPALLGFDLVRKFKSPYPEPRRLALGPENRLYLAVGPRIVVLDDRGNKLSEIRCGGPVRSVAVSPEGLVYAGLTNHVEVFDTEAKRVAAWEAPEGRPYLTGLAVDANHVFAADAGNRVVWRHDLDGKVLGSIGARDRDRNIPGLILPSPFLDVEIGSDGLLRINNPGRHRVELYTVAGDLELFWGKPSMGIAGFCGCCNPINLAVFEDGRVVTFEKGLPRVKVYHADGTLACVVAGTESFANTAAEDSIMDADEIGYGGLDGGVDGLGRVWVLDLLAAEIQVLQPKPNAATPPKTQG